MAKKDRLSDDLREEYNTDIDAEEGIDDILNAVALGELETLQLLIEEKFSTYIEEEIMEKLIDAYTIDITDIEAATKQIYNVYRKEFGRS